MKYTKEEVLQFVNEEDVKFIRLAFTDVYGKPKNISIMPDELDRAFKYGIAFDASAILGFGGEVHSDLFLHPDTSTLTVLPWRPLVGKVVRMFCAIKYPDGTDFALDTRSILKKAVAEAEAASVSFAFGAEMEFYLFQRDEKGEPTTITYDNAGYMDMAPEDKGENIRREICLTLEQMGIKPESSHHEEGPGQNEIDFRYSDPITAADNATTFKTVVNTIAARNGLFADFSAKPLKDKPGNGMHINFSIKSEKGDIMSQSVAGILAHINEITAFLNPTPNSYERFGSCKAPRYISWSAENRSQLIRIPAAFGEYKRAELRSPDPTCNPYLAFALIIWAALDGIKNHLVLPPPTDIDLYCAPNEQKTHLGVLPTNLEEAKKEAFKSDLIVRHLPDSLIKHFIKQ